MTDNQNNESKVPMEKNDNVYPQDKNYVSEKASDKDDFFNGIILSGVAIAMLVRFVLLTGYMGPLEIFISTILSGKVAFMTKRGSYQVEAWILIIISMFNLVMIKVVETSKLTSEPIVLESVECNLKS